MMRSLLCVGVPRDGAIDFPEDTHSHGHNSREIPHSSAAGRMRTAGRRLSLQISSKLGGRSGTEAANADENFVSTGAKLRRNSKHTSLSGISKKSIGHPEAFRHEQHVGFPGITGNAEVNWDLEKWREQIEAGMRNNTSHGQTVYPPTQGVRPKGPRPGSISRARPSSIDPSMGPVSPTTTGSFSQPNLHSSSQPTSASQPRASVTSVASLPAITGSAGAALGRSSSASGGLNAPRRKPVPSHLPAMTEVSPFPTMSASPTSAYGIPFSTQQTREQDDSRLPPHIKEEKADMAEGGTEVKAKRELVPLLGVPDDRVEGHEAHYVTKTTKARWDGAMSEIANALKDIDVQS